MVGYHFQCFFWFVGMFRITTSRGAKNFFNYGLDWKKWNLAKSLDTVDGNQKSGETQQFILVNILGGGFKYVQFSLYLEKIPILTSIFQMDWNHQLVYHLQGFIHLRLQKCFCCKHHAVSWWAFHSFSFTLEYWEIFGEVHSSGSSCSHQIILDVQTNYSSPWW